MVKLKKVLAKMDLDARDKDYTRLAARFRKERGKNDEARSFADNGSMLLNTFFFVVFS